MDDRPYRERRYMEWVDDGGDMIRIAVMTSMNRGYGGSFQYGISILNALLRLDPDDYLIALWYPANDDCITAFAEYPFEKHIYYPRPLIARIAMRLLRIGNTFLNNIRLARWLEKRACFVSIQHWQPDVCIRLEQGYIPLENVTKTIGPIHDLMHRYESRFPEVGTPREYRAREGMYTYHAATASAILVDSQVGLHQVRECYAPSLDRIFVLPLCASHLLHISPRKPDNFPLHEKQKFLFYPAQLWLHKNHANLLHAVALLREETNIHCVFTGTTDKSGFVAYKNAIDTLHLHEQVHHLGYVTDAEAAWLYQNAVCMVMPTFFGPTNIPPLEAMQLGCPVAVSDIYGMREQLADAALYFDPSRPEEIAASIKLLWQDEHIRATYRERGYTRAKQLSPEAFEQRFLNILNEVTHKK